MEGKYFGEVCCCGDDISSVLETDGAEEADGLASQPRGICGSMAQPCARQKRWGEAAAWKGLARWRRIREP